MEYVQSDKNELRALSYKSQSKQTQLRLTKVRYSCTYAGVKLRNNSSPLVELLPSFVLVSGSTLF